MRPTCTAFSFLAACFLPLATVSAAPLFEDTFDGSGDLDLAKWDWTTLDFTVARSSDWAVFDVSSGSSQSHGTALTDDAWNPDDYSSGLTWSIDFKNTGGDTPLVTAFLFGTLEVYLRYGDIGATQVAATLKGPIDPWTAALRNSGDALFKPGSANSYVQSLTVALSSTSVTATLLGKDGSGNADTYQATLSHDLTGAGHFGMKVGDGTVGDDKTVQFDNALLVPEPATIGLMGAGLASLWWLRRKRQRRVSNIER